MLHVVVVCRSDIPNAKNSVEYVYVIEFVLRKRERGTNDPDAYDQTQLTQIPNIFGILHMQSNFEVN